MVSPYLPEALARIMAAIVIPPELAFTLHVTFLNVEGHV